MLPEEFRQRISNQNYLDGELLLKALDEPSPVSIRTNPLKWNKKPVSSEAVPWCKTGHYLPERPSYTLDPLFHSGCYYPQEASSMFLEEVFRQVMPEKENLKVLDLCGAPGGKATHLSTLIGEKSLLITNEVIRQRASVLKENITRWGAVNTVVTSNDPSDFGRLPGFFDVILIDAPCSGEGMFRDTVAVNEWSVANTLHCSERQKRILMDAWPALKNDGVLIYSTCTFNPGENEHNIRWLTEKHEAECITIDVSQFKGISEIDYQGITGYGFHPGKILGEGFFISAIRNKCKSEQVNIKNRQKPDSKPANNLISNAVRWTSFQEERLIGYGDDIMYVACPINDYYLINERLRILKAGTKIFTVKNNDYLPSAEIALSVGMSESAFPKTDLGLDDALAYLRRDNLKIPVVPKGWFIITYQGINLGFAKNLVNRVNNYHPVEWRIRMQLPENSGDKILKWDK